MNNKDHTSLRPSLLATSICALLFGLPAIAQETVAEKDIERAEVEVLQVTAQKRVENMQEVPIAISAFSANTMKRIGVENINDLGNIAAGLETNVTSATQPKYNIRGIKTNDFGIGADPAVAVYVDGVYAGRSGAALVNFNDVERVEVLKGPQGTLFGRNAAAGAIHIITKRPNQETEGELELSAGNHGHMKLEGSYNTEIAKDVYFRGGVTLSERDGYIDARLYPNPQTEGEGDDYRMIKLGADSQQTLRAAILWEASDKTEVMFRTEFNEMDGDSRPIYSFNPDLYRDTDTLDPYGVYEQDFEQLQTRHLFGASIEVNHELDFATFTSITAFKRFDTENHTEDDGSANVRAYFASNNIERQKQFSQELRLAGSTDSGMRWTLGATYLNEDIYQHTVAEFMTESIDSFAINESLKALGLPPTGAPGMGIPGIIDMPLGTGLSGYLLGFIPNELAYLSSLTGFSSVELANMITLDNLGKPWNEFTDDFGDYTSYAAFADMTYPVTDKLDVTVGVRWTRDEKDFGILSYYQNEITIPIPGVPASDFGLAFGTEYVLRDEAGDPILDSDGMYQPSTQSNTWSKVTPRFVVDYQWSDDVMTYLSYAEGFKAGGFNSLGKAAPFAQEDVVNKEIGMKSTWLNKTLRLNLSAFEYDYTNLQFLRLTGSNGNVPVYNVRNVDASGQGFELESTWAMTPNLNITFNYAYLDTEYTRYALFEGETEADDLTGQPMSSVPKNRYFISGDYFVPLDGAELLFHVDYTWVDERSGSDARESAGALALLPYNPADIHGLTADNRVDAYDLVNARIVYISEDDWEVALYARNLLDEEYLLDAPGGQGTNTGSPNTTRGMPRSWGVQFTQRF
ncbi:TonB-dependent receptor [Bowmanella sp. JS7-9]|uniref:TonB-dependent receptor n=2 Tax=Pseudobowmanella zhangzhouensis TaxID=1537679 RepID=A0ABW1XMI8_9ALTE|nr:TonB-dependent receptor [Bowmanella sp. JS7-9]TBX20323.1 hypothetical protein TK45_15635 [Bowmanella sp. JS7-9]